MVVEVQLLGGDAIQDKSFNCRREGVASVFSLPFTLFLLTAKKCFLNQ